MFWGIKPYFVTFMKNQNAVIVAKIHIDWGRVVFQILRAGRLWGGLTVHPGIYVYKSYLCLDFSSWNSAISFLIQTSSSAADWKKVPSPPTIQVGGRRGVGSCMWQSWLAGWSPEPRPVTCPSNLDPGSWACPSNLVPSCLSRKASGGRSSIPAWAELDWVIGWSGRLIDRLVRDSWERDLCGGTDDKETGSVLVWLTEAKAWELTTVFFPPKSGTLGTLAWPWFKTGSREGGANGTPVSATTVAAVASAPPLSG